MTGERKDPYAVLGVPSTASPQQITHAFRRLVRRIHPDTQADPLQPHDLREVIAAYQLLRDPARRADYDRGQLPPRRDAVVRPGAAEPAIRVGPVRYHGPAMPTGRPVRDILTDHWRW